MKGERGIMNFKQLLKAKMDEQNGILNKALTENRALTEEEQAQIDKLEAEIKNLEKSIELQNKLDKRNEENNTPVNEPLYAEPKNTDQGIRVFKNFGEQLKAVRNAANGNVDDRLVRLNNEFKNATGMSEGVGADGGFAVQTDFAGTMMDSAAKAGDILSRVDSYQVSGSANGVKWIDIDESSVATTVFGGVQVYWASEASAVLKSKPALNERELQLQKLMGLAYATYELEGDTSFISTLYERAFTLAINRELESAIVSGDGKGKPLGILSSGALVEIAKETDQEAATVYWENLSKMYNRAIDKKANLVWLAHPDCHEQFDFLQFPVGAGGVPVYLQATQAGALDTIKGRPIIDSDHCSALGTKGDVNLVDLSQYFFIYKGGVDAATSMHVQFLTAENCFRFIFRANGMPKKTNSLTIKNSANKRSSFITLATRG